MLVLQGPFLTELLVHPGPFLRGLLVCPFPFVIIGFARLSRPFIVLLTTKDPRKRGDARGNGPADRGRRRRIASRTISGFAFGSPLFLNFVFEPFYFSRVFLFFIYRGEGTNLHFVHNYLVRETFFFLLKIVRFVHVQDGVKIYLFIKSLGGPEVC
jgi:hypothetical protein